MSTLSDRINQAMAAASMSQAELASACKIKSPSVNDWISGKTKTLKASTATRAAAALGIRVEWLATGQGEMRTGEIVTPALPEQPQTVTGLLESLRKKIAEQPDPIRAAIANLVSGYVMSPNSETGQEVAAMIEKMLSNK